MFFMMIKSVFIVPTFPFYWLGYNVLNVYSFLEYNRNIFYCPTKGKFLWQQSINIRLTKTK